MADEPIDLTQKILIDIQDRLARIEKKQDEGNLFMRDVALRATLIEVRLGQMQVSIDKVEGRLDKIEKHTGLVDA
jgi:hypothetical protein